MPADEELHRELPAARPHCVNIVAVDGFHDAEERAASREESDAGTAWEHELSIG